MTIKRNKILLLIFFAGIAGFLTGIYIDNHLLRMVTKPLPVLALLLSLKPDTIFKKLIFTGFIFSLLGDILLETNDNLFTYGLISFLIAHFFFINAFLKRRRSWSINMGFLLLLLGAGYFFYLYPHLGKMKIPVLVYLITIITMTWSAVTQYHFNKKSKYAVISALFFMFSDGLIAFTKFHAPLNYSHYIIIITYWFAQYLIFFSTKKQ